MLVTKLKMQSSPYGDSVISAQTEHLKIKGGEKKETCAKLEIFTLANLLKA